MLLRALGAVCFWAVAWFVHMQSASAHPLDVAYLDLGVATSSELTLTVALHPYQAFELVRGSRTDRFDVAKLQKRGDLVAAYAGEHVYVQRGEAPCTWDAGVAHTPPTELEALADGVTIAGKIICPDDPLLTIGSSLFLEGFPQQTAIVRFDLPEGFADQITLDRSRRSATLNLAPLLEQAPRVKPGSSAVNRRPDERLMTIARSLLNPELGWMGFIGLLVSALLIGALHALGPGHGKSLMAAVLVGEGASFKRVLALGTVMTLTHVSDVFLMALLAGAISVVFSPTQLLSFFEFISALGLTLLGVVGSIRAFLRYRLVQQSPQLARDEELHAQAHALGLPHTHGAAEFAADSHPSPQSKVLSPKSSFRRALWLGFVGSLAPCPTAWAMFMATVSIGKLTTGLALLIAFTVGLHATILVIGLLLMYSRAFAVRRASPRIVYALPIVSAVLVSGIGILLLSRTFIF